MSLPPPSACLCLPRPPADVRNRVSLPFRDASASDPAPLVGLRASPSGRHLLLLFRWVPHTIAACREALCQRCASEHVLARLPDSLSGWLAHNCRGAPSEIWTSASGCQPTRLRQVDLQFTAVEWLAPGSGPGDDGSGDSGGGGAPSTPGAPPAAWSSDGDAGSSPGNRSGGAAVSHWAASPRAAERAASGQVLPLPAIGIGKAEVLLRTDGCPAPATHSHLQVCLSA